MTGVDEHARMDGNSLEYARDPAGLTLVDVRRWTARVVDRDAASVTVASGLLLARGAPQPTPTPISAYDFAGRLRFNVGTGEWLQAAGDRAYVAGKVLELPSGRVLRRYATEPHVTILALDGSQFPL